MPWEEGRGGEGRGGDGQTCTTGGGEGMDRVREGRSTKKTCAMEGGEGRGWTE